MYAAFMQNALAVKALLSETPLLKRSMATPALVVSGTILALSGVGLLLFGGFLAIESRYGLQTAVLVTGGIVMLLALAIFGGLLWFERYKLMRIKILQRQLTSKTEALLPIVLKELEQPARNNPKAAACLAILAGLGAGKYICGKSLF